MESVLGKGSYMGRGRDKSDVSANVLSHDQWRRKKEHE
jgi:hypothetical protein